ncbi:MAG: protein CpxP [Paraglaciecola sp.]|jgi:protein CpxP
MKTIVTLAIASFLLIAPVTTVNAQQHGDKKSMDMMNEAKMEKMQKHMTKMNTILEEVRSETDTDKRQELLHKHGQSMGDMMTIMHGNNEGMGHSMGKQNMDMMKNSDVMPSEQTMEMMEKRLMMMEQMMEQVMRHTAEESKMLHEHKQ